MQARLVLLNMTEITKLIVPVILTSLFAIVINLFNEVYTIKDKQSDAVQYIIRIAHLEKMTDDYESRLRTISNKVLVLENSTCENCRAVK